VHQLVGRGPIGTGVDQQDRVDEYVGDHLHEVAMQVGQ
jgi:hypothetical protein